MSDLSLGYLFLNGLSLKGLCFKPSLLLWLVVLANVAVAEQCYSDPRLAYQALIAKQAQTKTDSERININTASVGELATLQGVGAKTAQAIVDYREMFGRFESVDDLTKVKGIGQKTLEKNRHRLVVY